MNNNTSILTSKRNILACTAISLIVFLEFYTFPLLFFRNNYTTITDFLFASRSYLESILALFVISAAVLILRKPSTSLRETPSVKFLLLHFLSLIAFYLFLIYIFSIYPIKPLQTIPALLKWLGKILPIDVRYLSIRYKLAFMVLLAITHASLILGIFRTTKVKGSYALALLASLSLYYMPLLNKFLWPPLCSSSGGLSLLLLKASGLSASTMRLATSYGNLSSLPSPRPIINTGNFEVFVGDSCSGLEGMTIFIMLFLILWFLNKEKINKLRAAIIGVSGVIIMYISNILRIFTLLLIGHFYNSAEAINKFHSYAGLAFYMMVIFIFLLSTYRWMTSKK